MGSFVIHIGDCEIKPTHRIKNLGVFYDPVMSMETHVNHVCKIAYMHIRNIGHIRRYLSEDATKSLVHAIVMSRMDYGNALLFGLPDYLTYRLQKVQNLCARIITFTPRRCHISPVLQSLHWLPIKRWLEYKVLLHTYKGLNGLAPGYLADMLEPYRPTRTLRSHDQQLLIVPKARTVTYGTRTFRSCSSRLWNTLPATLKSSPSLYVFKRSLKTYLFKSEYKC